MRKYQAIAAEFLSEWFTAEENSRFSFGSPTERAPCSG